MHEASDVNADEEQVNRDKVGNAEPHHHLSVELNVRPSGFEHGEAVEV